jgi:hypothetical protein
MANTKKNTNGIPVYGSAKKIDALEAKRKSGEALTEEEAEFLKNKRNEGTKNDKGEITESTGGGDVFDEGSKDNEFLKANNSKEADELRSKTNGAVAVRQTQNKDPKTGRFAPDDRNEDEASNIDRGQNFYKMTAPKSREEWRKLARKNPQEFAASVKLYLKRLSRDVTRKDFVDLSQNVDSKVGAKIRKIAIENNKKNLQKIRTMLEKTGNNSALKKMDKSLREYNAAVLKKLGFDPNEILGPEDDGENVENGGLSKGSSGENNQPAVQKEEKVEPKQEEKSTTGFSEQELNDAREVVAYKLNQALQNNKLKATQILQKEGITTPSSGQFQASDIPEKLAIQHAEKVRRSSNLN